MKKVFVFAFLFRLFISFVTWHPDVNNHIDWGKRFWEYGPSKFYSANVWNYTWPNQPPGTIYMFAAVRKLFEILFSFFWWVNVSFPIFPSKIITFFESNLYPALLKLPAILADLGIALIIYKVLSNSKNKKLALFGASIFLFNPVVWYNSAIWGQTDSIISFFAILSFYLILRKKIVWAFLVLSVSLYIKVSLAIYLPIFLIILLRQKYKLSKIVIASAISLLFIFVVTMPFSPSNPLFWLFKVYKDKVFTQQLQVITANAFNLWALLAGIHERPHTLKFVIFSYQVWGTVLFLISYLPALYLVYKNQTEKYVFWSLSIVSFAGFMLLTNMHERYLYPLFPVFTVVSVLETKMLPLYWTISGINLLNLYNFWWFPRIKVIVDALSFKDRLVPRLLGFVNLTIFAVVYSRFLRHLKSSKI